VSLLVMAMEKAKVTAMEMAMGSVLVFLP